MEEPLLDLYTFTTLLQAYITRPSSRIRYKEVMKMQAVFFEIRSEDPNKSFVKIQIDGIQLDERSSASSSSISSLSTSSSSSSISSTSSLSTTSSSTSSSNSTTSSDMSGQLTEDEKILFAEALKQDIIQFLNVGEEQKKKYAAYIVKCFSLISRHDLGGYHYLFKPSLFR